MARKKRRLEEEHENHERWLVTYADMITLLMVLFIVLFSMAAIDQKKFTQFKESLSSHKGAESVLSGSDSLIEGGQTDDFNEYPAEAQQFDFPDVSDVVSQESKEDKLSARKALQEKQSRDAAKEAERNNLEQVKQEISSALEARGMGEQVQFKMDRRGLVVSVLTDKVLFDSGSATIKPVGQEILNAIGRPLAYIPNDIVIEGHTDNVPINTVQFPTNWHLANARATSVLLYLVDHKDVTPERVGAIGFGEMRPTAPNDTPGGRAANRRVEIVIMNAVENGSQS